MMKTASIVGLLLLMWANSDRTMEQALEQIHRHPIHLGCEHAGVRLSMVQMEFGIPLEAGQRLAVSHSGQTILLRRLDQLRGLVQILDAETALRFVRLRTSPGTWHLWPDGPDEVEIIAASRARTLPSFMAFGHWEKAWSGLDGVLSDEVCRAVGFGPPRIQKMAGGFSIDRWIYAESGPRLLRSIQKVREYVGGDGAYKRATLAAIDPRRVPQLFIGRPQ